MNRKFTPLVVLLILTLVATACGKEATPVPTNTPGPTNTPALTATPEPSPTPEITLGEEYQSDAGGFTFQVIPDYKVEEDFGFVSMEAPDATPDFGPVILLTGYAGGEQVTPEQLLDAVVEDITDKEDVQASEPREIIVGDVPGLAVDLSGKVKGQEVAGRIVAVAAPLTQEFTMIGVALRERWDGELAPLFDAVLASVAFFEPIVPVEEEVAVPPPEETETPPPTLETPAGFLWRVGGQDALGEGKPLNHIGGMDIDRNGFLYVANNFDILVFDADGNLVEQIEHNEFNMIPDVSIGWSGNLYAASWGNNSVFVLDANGKILTQIGGEEGAGPGQFGEFSPQAVTVDLDENIYVLDKNEDAQGEKFVRVQVFDQEGSYLYEFPITEEYFGATDVEYNPLNDHLYVLGFVGGYMLEYDLQGNLIGPVGKEALDFTGPQRLDMDIEGNFYVSIWTPSGVRKLDPQGNLAAEFGEEVELSSGFYPEGAFAQPSGIAVPREGYPVYVADWSGEYSYITAFEFK